MPPVNLTGVGSGSTEPVYARAALLGDDSGRPTIDAKILMEASRRFAQGDGATDLVLVARDATIALLVPLPEGLALAGIIAEQTTGQGFASPIAVVSGVVGALRQIADGELVILDTERGRVLVEPAPEEFVRLQAERRRPRLFIGGEHVPARTQAGRQIDVWAIIRDDADIDAAQASGADGFLMVDLDAFLIDTTRASNADDFLKIDVDGFMPEDEDGEVDARPLLRATERIGGGDLGIVAGPEEIDAGVLLAVAARANTRWVIRPETLTSTALVVDAEFTEHTVLRHETLLSTPHELLEDLAQFARDAEAEAEKNGNVVAWQTEVVASAAAELPQVAALIAMDAADVDFLPVGFTELFLQSESLGGWTVSDTFGRPPLRVVLDLPPFAVGEDGDESLAAAVLLDIAGVVVPSDAVAATKDFIRRQAY